MSGNIAPKNWWSVPVKHNYVLEGYPTIKAAFIALQNAIKKFKSNEKIKYQTLSGFHLNSPEVTEVSDGDWRLIPKEYDKYNDAIYCIPHGSLTKVQPMSTNFISPTVSKIVAFVTDRDELIFSLALYVYQVCVMHKPLILTPGLEAEARAELIKIADANNDMELKEFLIKRATFTNFYPEIVYKPNAIVCANFSATTDKPTLLEQPVQHSSRQSTGDSSDWILNLPNFFSDSSSNSSLEAPDFFEVPSSSSQPQYVARPKPIIHSPMMQPTQHTTPLQQALRDLKIQQEQQKRTYEELIQRIEVCQTQEFLVKRLPFGELSSDSVTEQGSAAGVAPAQAITTNKKIRRRPNSRSDSGESSPSKGNRQLKHRNSCSS